MKTAFVLGLLLLSLAGVDCSKCYSCVGCNDPFDSKNSGKIDCHGSCLTVKAEIEGVHSVIRGCNDDELPQGCTELNVKGVKGGYCVCDTDLCNGSLDLKAPLKIFVFLALIIAALKKLTL